MAVRAKSGPSLKLVRVDGGDQKAALTAAGATSNNKMKNVPIDEIKIMPGLNARITDDADYDDAIEALKNSIMENGFYASEPLGLLASLDETGANVLYVLSGHRRFEAARRAHAEGDENVAMLPCVMLDIDDPADLTIRIDQENQQRALKPLERAVLVKRMADGLQMSDADIAKRMGLTPRYVLDLRILANAPPKVRQAVKEGKIAANIVSKKLYAAKENTDAAVADILGMVEKAEERGHTRATERNVSDDVTLDKAKFTTEHVRWKGDEGTEVLWEDIERFAMLTEDDGWYAAKGRSTKRFILQETVSFDIKIRRPTRAPEVLEEPEAEEPEAEVEAAPKKPRGGRRKAAEVDTGVDLEAAGIADRIPDGGL